MSEKTLLLTFSYAFLLVGAVINWAAVKPFDPALAAFGMTFVIISLISFIEYKR